MNIIEKLSIHIADSDAMIEQYSSLLAADQDNLGYRLTLKTLTKHKNDLQSQLRHEKSIRDKEIIELRLKGHLTSFGTIPLSILGEISQHFSKAIFTSSQRIKKGEDRQGRISQEIVNTLNLRFAGIGPGSTKLFLTGNCSPNLFGYSLIEDSLEKTFDLLVSKSPNDITNAIAPLGVRSVTHINNFLKSLSNNNIEIEIKWNSPSDKDFFWDGTSDNMIMLSNSLESIASSPPENIYILGELIMASTRGQFEIKDFKDNCYKGSFPSDLLPCIKGIHLGDEVEATIEREIIMNKTTGYEKISYSLVHIKTKTPPLKLPPPTNMPLLSQ